MTDKQIRIDSETYILLEKLAAHFQRTLKAQAGVTIKSEAYDVLEIGELPKPEGAESVPVPYIQKRDAA